MSRAVFFYILASTTAAIAKPRDYAPFVVYYAEEAPPHALDPYELLVLDPDAHPPLAPLTNGSKTVLGYLSLGEVSEHRSYFSASANDGVLLVENASWEGSHMVDVRHPAWLRRVRNELVPAILEAGFDGLFLDTLDNATYLENLDPIRFAGMERAAARLVRSIRRRYPQTILMMNRAYALLPEVEADIDILLGESVRSDYDFTTGRYVLVADALYKEQVELLQAAQARTPSLAVLTLDYWRPSDTRSIARIYREQRANGFEPYVATVELDRVIPEPVP